MRGVIYVVLPTNVQTDFPFAMNAPFIQDPERSKLKGPETSYTNRWLLDRVGKLAAESLLAWVQHADLPMEQRCNAYGFMLENPKDDGTLQSRCERLIYDSFSETLRDRPFLLCEDGELLHTEEAVAVPPAILDVWSPSEITNIFLDAGQSVLARCVTDKDAKKLEREEHIKILDDVDVLKVLENVQPSRPKTWTQLLALWNLSADNLLAYQEYMHRTDAQIIPVAGSELLYAKENVVRAGRRMADSLAEDWSFLDQHILTLDPEWVDFITSLSDEKSKQKAIGILEVLGLGHATAPARIVDHVAQSIFSEDEVALHDAVRIAHISAKLNVKIQDSMKFFTGDGLISSIDENLVVDLFGDIDLFVSDEWLKERVLHPDYETGFESCSRQEWQAWMRSGRSRLHPFVPLKEEFVGIFGREKFEKTLKQRGFTGTIPENSYVRSEKYGLHDWDFPTELWDHWMEDAKRDPRFWARLLKHILGQAPMSWMHALNAKPVFVARGGSRAERAIEEIDVRASWIYRLSELQCLEDTDDDISVPRDLFLRTPETEYLLNIGTFVHTDLDTDDTRPLLRLLGVRDKPTDSKWLLDRLRALAMAPKPPLSEIVKHYQLLDRQTENLETEAMNKLKSVFENENLILTEGREWAAAHRVFLEDNGTGVAVVNSLTKDLTLWHRIGVAEQPTTEMLLDLLKEVPLYERLSGSQLRWIKTLLKRVPEQAWANSNRWLNIEGELMEVEDFRYTLAEESLTVEQELFPEIRRETADLSFLSPDEGHFAELPSLASVIELRTEDEYELGKTSQEKPWIVAMARGLKRLRLNEEDANRMIQREADRLLTTVWQTVRGRLEIVPFIDATPVGTSRSVDAVWNGNELLVADRSEAQLAMPVVKELARPFSRQNILEAFRTCYERSQEFVTEYLEETFDLLSESEGPTLETPAPAVPYGAEDVAARSPESLPNDHMYNDPIHDIEDANGPVGIYATASPEQEKKPLMEAASERRPRHDQPTLIERFCRIHGYSQDGTSYRFSNAAGGWIEKGEWGLWDEYDSSGSLKQHYWFKEHHLEPGRPLKVPAEIWKLCDRYPETYSLVLTDNDGVPDTYNGNRLNKLVKEGKLKLHPAEYRLVIS